MFTLSERLGNSKAGPKQGPKKVFPVVETPAFVDFVFTRFCNPKKGAKTGPEKKACKLLDLRRALVRPQNAVNCSTL